MHGPLDYDAIAPLVAQAEKKYTNLYVTFRCPETGVEYLTAARLDDHTPVGGDIRDPAQMSRLRDPRRVAPFVIGDDPSDKPVDGDRPEGVPKGRYRHLIVRAFEPVQYGFAWNTDTKKYVGRR